MIREWWAAKREQYRLNALESQQKAEQLMARQKARLNEQRVVDGAYTRLMQDYFDRIMGDPNFYGAATTARRRNGASYPFFDNEQTLGVIREAARLLVSPANPHAMGFMGGLLAYTIGTGSTTQANVHEGLTENQLPQAKLIAKQVQELIDSTAKRNEFPSREQEFFTRSRRDGEAYFRLFHSEDGNTEIRFVWPEQIKQPSGTTPEEWAFGVRPDEDDGEVFVEYSVYPVMGDIANNEPDYVPAEEIVSVLCNVDRGVRRGLSDFSLGVADLLDSALGLEKSMAEGSRIQACIAFIRQHTNATQNQIQAFVAADATSKKTDPMSSREKNVRHYEPGTVIDTNQNMAFIGAPYNAGIPGHQAVASMAVRSAGVMWNAPEWLGSADASNNNYASSLTAESPFVKRVLQIQQVYIGAFRKLWTAVINHAIARGTLPSNTWELIDLNISLPTPETRNRLVDAQTAAIEIPLGVESRQNYTATQGREFDRIQADNEQYVADTGGMGAPLPLPTELPAS
jgi:hypothetical protein